MTEAPTQREIEAAIRCLKAAGSFVATVTQGRQISGLYIPDGITADTRAQIVIIIPLEPEDVRD